MSIFDSLFEVKPSTPAPAPIGGIPDSVPVSPAAPVAPQARRTAMEYSLEEILIAGGVEQGKNSAETVILMRAALAAFPLEQQRAMVRAMDATDASWDEPSVVADAQKRVTALAKYTELVAADEANRVSQIAANLADAKSTLDGTIADFDARIKQLQESREAAVQEITVAQKAAETQTQAVHTQADGVRQTVVTATEKYKELLGFFGK